MAKTVPEYFEINVVPQHKDDIHVQKRLFEEKYQTTGISFEDVSLTRRSIDARKGKVVFVLRYQLTRDIHADNGFKNLKKLPEDRIKKVVVVGAGPAGYFAAFQLISLGVMPIVVDRGKDVRNRRRDLRAIMQESIVNEDSNYCFGEGGAGTYSDGKLYTRSTKRGDVRQILHTFCHYGADPKILIDSNPHIGTNKLPKIIEAMRESILEAGGLILFNHRMTDFRVEQGRVNKVHFADKPSIACDAMILATGHSARDVYNLLNKKEIEMEAKPFALGVRVEHPQSLIDRIQYSCESRPDDLPASSYSVVAQIDGRGVFSFCMCPGGMIVPAATSSGELVVNGMSPSRRDSPFANSGFVTSVELDDIPKEFGRDSFCGMRFQSSVEKKLFRNGDGSQKCPAQRLNDFIQGRTSKDLPECSYVPGIYPAPLHRLLPDFIVRRLQGGFKEVGNRLRGYLTNEAVVVGVESRTSSPIRIPRDKEKLHHPRISNFFPCGEGAGYAGGIVSAGIDGVNVATAVSKILEIDN